MSQSLNHISGNHPKPLSGKAPNDQAQDRGQDVMAMFQDVLDAQLDVQPDAQALLAGQAADAAAPLTQASDGQILPLPDMPGGKDMPPLNPSNNNLLLANLPTAATDLKGLSQPAAMIPEQTKDLASAIATPAAGAGKKTPLAELPDARDAAHLADVDKAGDFSEILPQTLVSMSRKQVDVMAAGALPDVMQTRHDAAVTASPSPAALMSPLVNLAAHYPAGAAAPVAAPEISTPLNSLAWGQALEQKVVWMVGERQQAVHIQLNPPQLGPLEVQLQIDKDQATVIFSSPHGAVREAVEAAMPRLQQSFEQQGLGFSGTCLNADPGSQFAQQRQSSSQTGQQQTAFLPNQDGATTPVVSNVKAHGEGLVNLFV